MVEHLLITIDEIGHARELFALLLFLNLVLAGGVQDQRTRREKLTILNRSELSDCRHQRREVVAMQRLVTLDQVHLMRLEILQQRFPIDFDPQVVLVILSLLLHDRKEFVFLL